MGDLLLVNKLRLREALSLSPIFESLSEYEKRLIMAEFMHNFLNNMVKNQNEEKKNDKLSIAREV